VAGQEKLERLMNLYGSLMATSVPIPIGELRQQVSGYEHYENDASFRRTFERDKDDLRDMGVDVRVEPVPFGEPGQEGYIVHHRDQLLPPIALDPDEHEAVQLAIETVRMGGRAEEDGLRALGGRVRPVGAEPVAAELPPSPLLAPLFTALTDRRVARFLYGGMERVVHPWRVECRGGQWYLGGHDELRSAHRTFRLDRIQSEIVLGESGGFEPAVDPPRLQLDPWLIGGGERRMARVSFDAAHVTRARSAFGADTDWEIAADGSGVASVPVTNTEAFRSAILEFLDHAVVLGPEDLRQAVLDFLDGTVGES